MKRKKFLIGTSLLLLSVVSFQSCIGSFSLTNKVLTWNKNVNNKFVNELVFFAFWVLPVYEVTATADLLVINSIEFWSGNNPLEANNRIISTDDGNYRIFADESGYKVLTPEDRTMNFLFDKESQTWSFCWEGQTESPFLKFIDENHVKMLNSQGEFVDVELSTDGVSNYYSLVMPAMMAMQ